MITKTYPWLDAYPVDVPESMPPLRFSSLAEFLSKKCKTGGDKVAFNCLGSCLTYAEFDILSDHLANYFQNKLKLNKGDRLALMLPNISQFPIAMAAGLKAGLIVTHINPLYTASEVKHQLLDSNARALVVLSQFMDIIDSIQSLTDIRHVIVTHAGDMLGRFRGPVINFVLKYIKKEIKQYNVPFTLTWKSVMNESSLPSFIPPEIQPTDIAFLQYTGGTTGPAKGAVLTHGNLLSNLEQGIAWVSPYLSKGNEIVVTALPLYHIFSLTVCCFCFLDLQGTCLLIPNPRDKRSFIRSLKKTPATVFVGLNTLFSNLLKSKDFSSINFNSYKVSISGGMSLQESVANRWQEVTGLPIIEGYGLTETSPLVCAGRLDQTRFTGSVGLPLPSTQVQVRDLNGIEVKTRESGELYIKGPQVMQGYWNQANETESIFKDGWLKTGDIGYMDEAGYFYIIDRKKDMVIVSGFNVYPNEIEAVITAHVGVAEAAVIGEKSSDSGEALKAYVILNEGVSLSENDIIRHCRTSLTAYKVPKIIKLVKDLPRSNVGKVLKRKLK